MQFIRAVLSVSTRPDAHTLAAAPEVRRLRHPALRRTAPDASLLPKSADLSSSLPQIRCVNFSVDALLRLLYCTATVPDGSASETRSNLVCLLSRDREDAIAARALYRTETTPC